MSKNELSSEEADTLKNTDLSNLIPDANESFASQAKKAKKKAKKAGETTEPPVLGGPPPKMSDPEWHDYVIRQFTDSELDNNGCPYIHGLRRVARQLLGPIIKSLPTEVYPPKMLDSGIMGPATCVYQITFLWSVEDDTTDNGSYEVTYGGTADVHHLNTDPEYARHGTATAETKAEARALRKALGLGKVIAADERTIVPFDNFNNGKILPEQITWLDMQGRRHDLDIMTIINSNKDGKSFNDIREVEYDRALKITEFITETARLGTARQEWLGYKEDWRKVV